MVNTAQTYSVCMIIVLIVSSDIFNYFDIFLCNKNNRTMKTNKVIII